MTFRLRFLAVFGRPDEDDPHVPLIRLFLLAWFGATVGLVAAMAVEAIKMKTPEDVRIAAEHRLRSIGGR